MSMMLLGAGGTDKAAASITPATFNGTTTNVTLSNGNLTATHSNTSDGGTRSASNKSTGKFYFEITIGASNGSLDGIGLIASTKTFSDMASLDALVYALNSSIGSTGGIFINGGYSTKHIGLASAGDVISIAVDMGAGRAWFRRNGGDWNGDPSADPVASTNYVGPFNGTLTSWAPAVDFSGSASGNNFTANFGATSFTYTVPSGFTAGWSV